jgi:hypothetical protein
VLKVEILSPSNRAEAWRNVWLSTAIPSIREHLILSGTASLLRRSTGQHDSRGSETFEVRGPLLPHSRWQRGNRDDGCLDLGDRLPSHDRERATILQRISAAKKRNVFSALFLLRIS